MSYLVADIPLIVCQARREYFYDHQAHHGEYEEVIVHGVKSLEGHALMFQVITNEGVVRDHLPLAALVHKEHAPHLDNHLLQLWDCFSEEFTVHTFGYLSALRVSTALRDKSVHWGEYLFTIDWCGNAISELPGEGGHKTAHVLKLDCGCFAAQPNHRCLFREPSFVVRPREIVNPPDHLVNTRVWRCEQHGRWQTPDNDRFFYGTEGASE